MSLDFERNIAEGLPIKFARIVLDLVFAWGISSVICTAGNFAAVACYSPSNLYPSDPPELVTALIAVIQFGAGAFCLGTLAKKTNMCALAILFVLPLFVLLPSTATTFPALTKPLFSILLCFAGSVCAIAVGQSTVYDRDNSALNIPWYHWLWLFPSSLFQAVCVPLFVIFVFFHYDTHQFDIWTQLCLRLCLIIVMRLTWLTITLSSKILSSKNKMNIRDKAALVYYWLILTFFHIFIFLFQVSKDYAD